MLGLGHVMRCIALAEQCVNRGGAAWLLSEAVPDRVGRYCRNAGIQRITVARHCPDDELVLRHCARMRAAPGADPVCVLDGYDLGAGLREAIRSAGLSLVVIDDNADKGPYRADVVVNPNVYANAGDYGVDPDTEYLCGPAYHLLREEIRGTRRRSVHPERARRVLVNMGGTDPHDHTSAAMESLMSIGAADISASVVVGQAYPHLGNLETLLTEAPFDVRVLRQPRLGPVYEATEMAVTAGGSTALELAYLGIPMLVRITAENQLRSATWLRDNGSAKLLDSLDSVGSTILAACRDVQWRRQTSDSLRPQFDGLGPGRVMDALEARKASHLVGSA